MSTQDLENRAADPATQANTHPASEQAEAVKSRLYEVLCWPWNFLWLGRSQEQPVDQANDADDEAAEIHKARGPSSYWSLFPSFCISLPLSLKIQRMRTEPKDGFTSSFFNSIAKPLPVKNLFILSHKFGIILSVRTAIMLRLTFQALILLYAGVLFYATYSNVPWLSLSLVVLVLQMKGVQGIGRIDAPTVQQLWDFRRYPQRSWEALGSRVLLRSSTAGFWWLIYLLVSDLADFEQNFVAAWSQRTINRSFDNTTVVNPRSSEDNISISHDGPSNARDTATNTLGAEAEAESGENRVGDDGLQSSNTDDPPETNDAQSKSQASIPILVEDECLHVPLVFDDMKDSDLLEQFKMFYRYLKVKRGLVELIKPRLLVRINCVKVDENARLAGETTGILDCGRRLQYFYQPDTVPPQQQLTKRIQDLIAASNEGLEFERILNRRAISSVIMVPPMASLVFIVVWLAVLGKQTVMMAKLMYRSSFRQPAPLHLS